MFANIAEMAKTFQYSQFLTANIYMKTRSFGLMIFIVNRLDDTFFTQFFSEARFEVRAHFTLKKVKPGLGSELWDVCLIERTYLKPRLKSLAFKRRPETIHNVNTSSVIIP